MQIRKKYLQNKKGTELWMILEKVLRNLNTTRQTFSSQRSRNDNIANKKTCEFWQMQTSLLWQVYAPTGLCSKQIDLDIGWWSVFLAVGVQSHLKLYWELWHLKLTRFSCCTIISLSITVTKKVFCLC